MVDQDAHRPRHVADRRLVALPADPLALPLGGRGQQAVLAAEAADDGLHRDAGAARHLLQRDLVGGPLPEHLDGGVEDPLAGGRGRLGPRHHPVRALG